MDLLSLIWFKALFEDYKIQLAIKAWIFVLMFLYN